jgi:hypothetical protein
MVEGRKRKSEMREIGKWGMGEAVDGELDAVDRVGRVKPKPGSSPNIVLLD